MPLKSHLKATAVLSSGAVVTIVTGLVSAKVSAVLLGPAGMGFMGLVLSLVSLAGIIAGMGIGVGLVRGGARAVAEADVRQEAVLRAGAWRLCWILGGSAALLMIVLRAPLSELMLGGPQHGGAVAVSGVALLLLLATGLQTSILTVQRRIGELARASMLSSVLGVTASVAIISGWRARGIVWAVLASCGVSWAVSYSYVRRCAPASRPSLSRREVWAAAGSLLRFGGPYTGSLLVGAGVQSMLPVLVLHALTTDDVGFYRAAVAVSTTYLGFLITAMSQDYYPRLSAVVDQPVVLRRLINDQCRLVLLVIGPVILGMLALVPSLVPLVYSAQFVPAVSLLEWQLIGDIFKFVAWTMSYVICARCSSLTFFFLELVGGTLLLLGSSLGMRWLGLEGLGVGFVFCTALYCLLCWTILRRDIGLRWTRWNTLTFMALILAAAIIRALPYLGLEHIRTPVALALATLAGAGSLYVISGEMGGLVGVLAWRKAP